MTALRAVAGLAAALLSVQASAQNGSCGNGKIDVRVQPVCAPCPAGTRDCPCSEMRVPLEDCDGADVGEKTCQTAGYFSGTLRCSSKCTIDTTGCKKLESDLDVRHLTIGPAPSSAALTFGLPGITVTVQSAGHATSRTYFPPDLRPDGQPPAQIDGEPVLRIPRGFIAAQRATGVVLFDVGRKGELHTFPTGHLDAFARSVSDTSVLALSTAGKTTLQLIDVAGRLAKAGTLQLAGTVRSIDLSSGGVVVTSAADEKELQLTLLSTKELKRLSDARVPMPTSFALMHVDPAQVALVTETPEGTRALLFDEKPKLAPGAPVSITDKPMRVIGGGYLAGSRNSYAVLDDRSGGIYVVRFQPGGAQPVMKLFARHAGARVLASTEDTDRIYVAWTSDDLLHLSVADGRF